MRPLLETMTSIKGVDLNRNLWFRSLALLKMIEAIINVVLSIALAKIIGVWAMVCGMIGGAAAMVITSYFIAP